MPNVVRSSPAEPAVAPKGFEVVCQAFQPIPLLVNGSSVPPPTSFPPKKRSGSCPTACPSPTSSKRRWPTVASTVRLRAL